MLKSRREAREARLSVFAWRLTHGVHPPRWGVVSRWGVVFGWGGWGGGVGWFGCRLWGVGFHARSRSKISGYEDERDPD